MCWLTVTTFRSQQPGRRSTAHREDTIAPGPGSHSATQAAVKAETLPVQGQAAGTSFTFTGNIVEMLGERVYPVPTGLGRVSADGWFGVLCWTYGHGAVAKTGVFWS